MRRPTFFLIAPTVALIALSCLPMIEGGGTLYYRDFLTSHLPLKAAQAQLMQDGHWLPLIDPFRSGGQPLLGNPNALPLYPSNLLFLVASPLWALNAHIWLHWLLAPFAFAWLGRAWGLGRTAAWAGAVTYATSGYFLSLFNLYNLVAGAVLAPALIAASLEAAAGRPRRWPMVGALWALLILSGDPMTAALALALAAGAVLLQPGAPWPKTLKGAVPALALGTLVAAPMWVEMLRILPASFRGHWRYDVTTALAQSWDPRTALEWVLPFFFGNIDYSFWGRSFYGGNPPLLYSLYPGTLAVVLVLLAGRPRRGWALGWWAWGSIAVGGFLALGFYNPAMHVLIELPGASALRYPIKIWLAVAIGASALAGYGFERARAGGRLGRLLAIAAGFYLALWLALVRLPAPFADWLRSFEPERFAGSFFEVEHLRWTSTSFYVLLTAIGLLAAAHLLHRRAAVGAALLIVLHVASQTYLLKPLFDTDLSGHFTEPPEILAHVPPDARVVHGAFNDMFDGLTGDLVSRLPDTRFFWLTRESFAALGHFAGIQHGRRYELNHSPEGLDTFLSIALNRAFEQLEDPARVRLLAASGVDRLILHRPLEGVPELEVTPLHTEPGLAWSHHVYRLERPLPPYQLIGRVLRTPHLNAAMETMIREGFDPRHMAVVRSGDVAANLDGPPGTVRVLEEELERFVVEVDSPGGGVLVTRRAWLPLYRAAIDGASVAVAVANLHKLGVAVPAGRHTVEVWADRRPTRWSAAAAVLALGLLALWGRSTKP